MKLPRIYQDHCDASFALEAEAAHHLGHVVRLGAGERFIVSDGKGRDFLAEVVFSGDRKRALQAKLLHSLDPIADPRPALQLGVALCKGERFERLIEKAAELGVTSFVPLLTAHSLGADRAQRRDRWQRLAREASALAGRSRWMEVCDPRTFDEVLALPEPGVLFTQGRPYQRRPEKGSLETSWLLIGPEGGFTDHEVEQAERGGGSGLWRTAGLGPRNLRVETAAVVAIALALFENGEFEVGHDDSSQS